MGLLVNFEKNMKTKSAFKSKIKYDMIELNIIMK